VKLHVKLNIKKGSYIKLKVYFPEKNIFTSISAEVTWTKIVEDKLEAGLKITEMDEKAKKEILDWISSGQIKE
ncbi:MAG: PilZ domain-containing protein, partial [Candidatus Aminicenantes bacterium]|nr:PilZ domain-containing protein [Candidatus Aminicenantes bacterium]